MPDKEAGKKEQPPARKPRHPHTYENRGHKLATLYVMTAGSAHVTQFPMMFIVYGGAPFLLAYLVFLGGVAYPMMRLESNLAQFAGDGNRGIFSTVPFFIGVGYSMTLYMVTHAVADSLPLSESLRLLFLWRRTIYWPHECPGAWLTQNSSCYAIKNGSTPCKLVRDWLSKSPQRDAVSHGLPIANGDRVTLVLPSFYTQVAGGCIPNLQNSAPPYDFRQEDVWVPHSYGLLWTPPIFAAAAVWMTVFAIANSGFLRLKTFFYGLVLIHLASSLLLLTRASTLKGALRGLSMLVHANWTSAMNWQMWSRALYMSLESVGVVTTIFLGVERFNNFNNKFQEDVMFVLAADTATKGIGTVTAFLCLGHLSYSTGLDIHMLVDTNSNFVVSLTPQALSLSPNAEFWSRVYSLWLASMMLPKFLIMPDIVIEVLAASHPMLLDNRRAAHFIICALLSMLTFASCVPGGAKVVSVIAAHQNIFRLVLLVVEAMAILQFYGVRRLCIDSKLMTDEEPGLFVRFCWTSVIPITFICAIWAKLAPEPLQERRYPLWLRVMLAWLDVVELSFIPVFAIVLILATKLNLHDSLAPLPTWGPVNWELCMKYRQTLVAEGLDKKEQEAEIRRKPVAELAAPPPTPKRRHSRSISSSDVLGTHLILTTDAKVSPMTSDWRYDSSEETKGESLVKFRSPPNEVVPESGTLAISRHPSSMWRSIKAKVNRVVISTPVSLASKLSHSAEVAAKATENHKRERAAAGLPSKTTKEPVDEAACIAADLPSPSPPMGGRETDAKPPQVVTPAIECDVLVRDMGDPLENVVGPVDPAIGHHPPPGQSSPDTIPQPSPPSPVKLPSASLLPLPESTYHGVLPPEHVAEAREKKTPGAESDAPLLIGESRAFVPAGEETPREAVVAASPRLEPHLSPGQSAVSMPEPSPQCEEPKLAVAMNGSLEARARQPECASPAQNTAVPPLPGCSQADGGVGALPRGDAVDVKAPQPQDRADARKTVRSPASPGPHHVRKGHRQKRHLELPDRRAKKSKPGEAFSPAVVVMTPPGAPSDQSVASPLIWPEAKSAGATETVPNDRVPLSAPVSPAVKAKRDRKNKSLVTSPVHPKGAGTTSKSTVQTHSQALDAQYAEQGALSATLSSKGNDNSSSAAPSGAQSPKHKKRKATARKGPFKERAHRRRTPEQATLSPGTPDGKTARAPASATPTTKSPSPLVSGADSVAPDVLPLLSPAPQVSGSLEQLNCRPADTNGDFRDLAGTPQPHGSAAQPANTTAPQAPPGDDISPLSRQGASPSSQPTQSPPVASPPNRPTQSPRSAEPAENGAVDANRDPASAGQVHRHHKRAKMEHLEKKNAGTSSAHGLHGRPKNSEPKDYHRAK